MFGHNWQKHDLTWVLAVHTAHFTLSVYYIVLQYCGNNSGATPWTTYYIICSSKYMYVHITRYRVNDAIYQQKAVSNIWSFCRNWVGFMQFWK